MRPQNKLAWAYSGGICARARPALLALLLSSPGSAPAAAQGFWDGLWGGPSAKQRAANEAVAKCKASRAEHRIQWAAYDKAATRYWTAIGTKRQQRRAKRKTAQPLLDTDYVTIHPPVYTGPKWPKCRLPSDAKKKPPKPAARASKPLPTVVDFLAAAKKIYGFEPRGTDERGYKASYAREAIREGLSAQQVVGVYALETGGIGPYARQSGIFITDQKCRPRKARGRAASTALGYAQLLAANSVAVARLQGDLIAAKLAHQARQAQGGRAIELQLKSQMILRMRRDIITGTRAHPRKNGWREYVAYGKTPRGLAVHALNLDADVGPMLQVYKLRRIKLAAAKKGFQRVSGAQMELMNLVGYGRGLEMMQKVAAKAASANFFSRKAYGRNPLAKNLTARGLLAKIDGIIAKRMRNCGSIEFMQVFRRAERQADMTMPGRPVLRRTNELKF